MGKHAEYSGSQAAQWLGCPGAKGMKKLALSFLLADKTIKVIQEPQSEAALEGTAAHQLLEICLTENLDGYEMIDRKIVVIDDTGEEHIFIVDDDMSDAVQVCIDLVNIYKEKYPGAEVTIEQHIDISSLCGKDMFGTVDIKIAVPFDRLIVIDYKHGRGVPVYVEENKQLLYYSLGAALEDDFEFETVEMVIVQPRCFQNEDIQIWEQSIEEVQEWAPRFKKGRIKAEKATKEIIKAGKPIEKNLAAGDWCKFCPAQTKCPAKYNQMIKIAQLDFADEEDIFMVPVLELDTKKRIDILNHGDEIKKYIDAVYGSSKEVLERGEELKGWKLVKARSNAKFIEVEIEVIKLLVKRGFKKKEILRTKLETLTTLRKLCGEDVIAELTYNPDKGNTIAPDSDKRPAVVPAIISDFDDEDEDDS